MASAIAMTLGMTAFAQNAPRPRTPNRIFQGRLDISNANIAPNVTPVNFNSAQGPGPGPRGMPPGCDLFPAPPSVGATVDLSYFGPSPSTVNRSLVGPVQLLNTGPIDSVAGTITIPLYLGHMKNGKNVWYMLTDVDDSDVADELGLNFSAKLTFAATAARTANFDQNNDLVFDKGTVDFSPVRSITPGPAGQEFPPLAFQPGSVGDKDYSPLVQVVNAANVIYNAPIVAFDVTPNQISFPNGNVDYSMVHDQVLAIDPINMTVTINLINGFSFGKPVWYMSMDASIPASSLRLSTNTFAPLSGESSSSGRDDSFSQPDRGADLLLAARTVRKKVDAQTPLRQGLKHPADLADGFSAPNNVLGRNTDTNALDYLSYLGCSDLPVRPRMLLTRIPRPVA